MLISRCYKLCDRLICFPGSVKRQCASMVNMFRWSLVNVATSSSTDAAVTSYIFTLPPKLWSTSVPLPSSHIPTLSHEPQHGSLQGNWYWVWAVIQTQWRNCVQRAFHLTSVSSAEHLFLMIFNEINEYLYVTWKIIIKIWFNASSCCHFFRFRQALRKIDGLLHICSIYNSCVTFDSLVNIDNVWSISINTDDNCCLSAFMIINTDRCSSFTTSTNMNVCDSELWPLARKPRRQEVETESTS